MQRLSVGSGQLPVSKPTPARVDALPANPQKPAPDPDSDRESRSICVVLALIAGLALIIAFGLFARWIRRKQADRQINKAADTAQGG